MISRINHSIRASVRVKVAATTLVVTIGVALGFVISTSASTPPSQGPILSNEVQVPNVPNVVRSESTGPMPFVEVHGNSRPVDVSSVPAQIPTQGVVVNNDFELFPWGSVQPSGIAPKTVQQSISSSKAISACNKEMVVPQPTGVTTTMADFTDPGSIPNQQATITSSSDPNEMMDVPSWIVDTSMTAHQMEPDVLPGMPMPSVTQPTVANMVCVVNAYTGDVIFSTATP